MAPVVLITGTSTGLGAACVERLAGAGWTVLAGVRREADGQALQARVGGDVRPLLLDVTDARAIERAAATVAEVVGERGLQGLVNNAGVPVTGPIELVPVEQWRAHLEVNLLGAVALTRALYDQVRTAGGRFVFIGSQFGRIGLPSSSLYAAGKHALEAVVESLHHELAGTPMRAVLIEPGLIRTPLLDKTAAGIAESSGQLAAGGGDEHQRLEPGMRVFVEAGQALGMPADRVARRVEHALSAARPRRRDLVGIDARLIGAVTRLPDPLRDRIVAGVLQALIGVGRRRGLNGVGDRTPTERGEP